MEKQRTSEAEGRDPTKPRGPEGVVRSEDGATWQGTVWGLERWEMRLGRQVLARTEEASGLG